MRKALRSIWRIITAPFRFIARLLRSIWRWFARTAGKIHAFFTQEVDDAPVADALNKAIDDPMGLFEHLDALRKHLLRSVLVLGITTAFAFTFFTPILELLSRPLEGGMESLVAIEVTEPIGTVMRVSLLTGFSLAFPYIALELFLFVAPGLSRRARVLWAVCHTGCYGFLYRRDGFRLLCDAAYGAALHVKFYGDYHHPTTVFVYQVCHQPDVLDRHRL